MLKQILIFTDLDGTLLDHQTYAWTAARPAIERLGKLDIPLILNSSKTQAEIMELRQELNNQYPYVVENGGAVCVPKGCFKEFSAREHIEYFGPSHNRILTSLAKIRNQKDYAFKSFNDCSSEELAHMTGLPLQYARLAKQRLCTEPLQWEDSEQSLANFRRDIQKAGLTLIKGGRFYHVMGNSDKVQGVKWLIRQYRKENPEAKTITIALGDSPNDQKMLEAVDIPVVIKAENGELLRLQNNDSVIYAENKAPQGWQWAVDTILDRLVKE